MRIQTEYRSFENLWMISSSYDFLAKQLHSRGWCCFFHTSLPWFKVLSVMLPVLPAAARHVAVTPRCSQVSSQCSPPCHCRSQPLWGALTVLCSATRFSQTCHNHFHGTPELVIRDSISSKGWPEHPPRVWYFPEIDAFKFTVHILSDPPGGSPWPKYLLLMFACFGWFGFGGTLQGGFDTHRMEWCLTS